MAKFEAGNKIGKGRKAGSKNAINKTALIDLINACATDLSENFDKLSTNQKIKVLTAFREVYRTALTDEEHQDQFQPITVNIINGKDDL